MILDEYGIFRKLGLIFIAPRTPLIVNGEEFELPSNLCDEKLIPDQAPIDMNLMKERLFFAELRAVLYDRTHEFLTKFTAPLAGATLVITMLLSGALVLTHKGDVSQMVSGAKQSVSQAAE